MARPTLTSVKIRYKDPLRWIIGRVDPAWGVPDQNVPMVWDVNTLMYRPFNSILAADLADAVANFAGWSDGFVQPRANEEACFVTIVTEGIVEVLLDQATAITTETLLAPTVGTVISNDTFAATATPAEAIMKVIKTCSCGDCRLEPCPPDAAEPTAIGTGGSPTGSPSELAVYPDRRTAWAYFNVAYTSGA
jgi:hypothetical protein